jgi:hypothetical protein
LLILRELLTDAEGTHTEFLGATDILEVIDILAGSVGTGFNPIKPTPLAPYGTDNSLRL